MNRRILIVDDEIDLAELLAFNLGAAGYETRVAHDGHAGIELARSFRPDAIVLDVMMPELSGLEVARRLRADAATRDTAILMLTARAEEPDEVKGLEAGADDFVAKPFSMKVLEARVEALLRRAGERRATAEASTLSFGPIEIDTRSHEASADGKALQLTVTEFRLLAALVAADGHVLSRPVLISRAMGKGVTVTERTIDVHITSIRKKLGVHANRIRTVRGVGYRVIDPEAERGKRSTAAAREHDTDMEPTAARAR